MNGIVLYLPLGMTAALALIFHARQFVGRRTMWPTAVLDAGTW
jgi:hypothetical protein